MNHIFVAGTFDGLHAGHRRLLAEAFRAGERVTIGLTSNFFISRYKSKFLISKSKINPKFKIQKKISSYMMRRSNLESWLHEQSYFNRASIIPISDPHEPAASMDDLDALIVTKENRKIGERINALRQGSTLKLLTLIEVPIVAAEDGNVISSTRMRNGEIDRNGRLIMPESMRKILGKPLGTVLEGAAITASIRRSLERVIITVGDMATKTVLDAGMVPRLAIIDGKVGRRPFHETLKILQLQKVKPFRFQVVKSGPGFISREAIEAVRSMMVVKVRPVGSLGFDIGDQMVKKHHALIIDGEEDLLVLPVIEYAPLGSILYYGQPNEGLVEVMVSEKIKWEIRTLLLRFT